MARMLAKVNPEDWAQFVVNRGNVEGENKSPASSKSSPTQHKRKQSLGANYPACPSTLTGKNADQNGQEMKSKNSSPLSRFPITSPQVKIHSMTRSSTAEAENAGHAGEKCRSEVSENRNVVVSSTVVPTGSSSVTVSVLCPEVANSKARKIFWARNPPPLQEKNGADCNPQKSTTAEFTEAMDTSEKNDFWPLLPVDAARKSRYENGGLCFLPIPGGREKSDIVSERVGKIQDAKNRPPCTAAKNVQAKNSMTSKDPTILKDNQPDRSTESNREIAEQTFRNDQNIVAKKQCESRVSNMYSEKSEVIKYLQGNQILRDFLLRDEKRVFDHAELDVILAHYSSLKGVKIAAAADDSFGNSSNSESWKHQQHLLALNLHLKLQRCVEKFGNSQQIESLRKLKPLNQSETDSNGDRNNGASSGDVDHARSERDVGVNESGISGNEGGKIRESTAPSSDKNQLLTDIKTEVEEEPEPVAEVPQENPSNEARPQSGRMIDPMVYLVQAKIQSATSELTHQLKLQKLELEEKELKVKIAEMTVQETKLRIESIVEEKLRAKELHDLRLGQIAAEKARAEAEHTARIEAACVATAVSRARITNVERDRERSEGLHQLQLQRFRSLTANSNNANGMSNLNFRQYQQQ
ncbi:uncharacterized protein LOC110117116 [Athalia rosae]|uniref:uncharacterized protein LOC110117116 n=1 Tax=Athalia rosae TaxID=37344 RepID=UPI0020347D62|nr:uncharacterized protein LOC110117116 [Athalia rosae]